MFEVKPEAVWVCGDVYLESLAGHVLTPGFRSALGIFAHACDMHTLLQIQAEPRTPVASCSSPYCVCAAT